LRNSWTTGASILASSEPSRAS